MTGVAPPILYIADPLDETMLTRLVDLNGATFGVVDGTFDLGELAQDEDWIGDVQARVHHPPPRMSMRLFLKKQASVRNLLGQVDLLNQALDSPGVLVMSWGGFAETEFADFYRSPLTRAFRDEERNLWHILGLLQDPDGLPVQITRAPARRLSIRQAEDNLALKTAMVEADDDGVPLGWTWADHSTISGDAFSWRYRAYTFVIDSPGTVALEQEIPVGPLDGAQPFTWQFAVAGTWSGVLPPIRAEIEWLDGSGDQIGGTVVGSNASLLFAPQVAFSGPYVSATAPSTTMTVRVRMAFTRPVGGTVTLWVRDPQLVQQLSSAGFLVPFRVGVQAVDNASKTAWLFSPGNTPSPVQVRAHPDDGSFVERVSLARRSGNKTDVAEYSAISVGRFADAVLESGAALVPDGDASGGEAVEVTHTPGTVGVLRVNIPQSSNALLGRHVLWVAMKPELAAAFTYQLRWGTGNVEALPYFGQIIPADTSDPDATQYVAVPLGEIVVPRGASGLYFEILASGTPASPATRFDLWWLTPAELVSVARIPGVALPGQSQSREWIGSDFITPPASVGTFGSGTLLESGDYLLQPDSPDQAAAVPPVTGYDFEDVRHLLVAHLNTFNDDGSGGRVLGEFRLHDLSTDTQVAKVQVKTVKGQRWRLSDWVLKFTPAAGHLYMPYVVETAAGTPGNNIHLIKVTDTFSPPIDGSDSIAAMDGDSRLAYILQGTENAGQLDLDPPFLEAAPGLQLIRVDVGDATPSGWDHVFPFPVQAHVASRGAMLGLSVIPRKK